TRSYTDHWKTGFYRIAQKANVPIHLIKLDYAKKIATIGPTFIPTGDLDQDMDIIRDFYADTTPKFPEKQSDIRARRRSSSNKRNRKT
ncbi:MAG: acyltransferase, partial [Candidatus Hydrogenedentes bacterium]|nr:acyltransferase [Candidatus Hydrogenedentota bacterium]